eukprot:symbB.v1.2.034284.t2/scaffold4397.1/size40204/4
MGVPMTPALQLVNSVALLSWSLLLLHAIVPGGGPFGGVRNAGLKDENARSLFLILQGLMGSEVVAISLQRKLSFGNFMQTMLGTFICLFRLSCAFLVVPLLEQDLLQKALLGGWAFSDTVRYAALLGKKVKMLQLLRRIVSAILFALVATAEIAAAWAVLEKTTERVNAILRAQILVTAMENWFFNLGVPWYMRLLYFVLCGLSRINEAQEDVFRINSKERNPREAAFETELRFWTNISTPWQHLRLVATMTTTPRRIDFIEPALDSLLQQSRSPDVVYLFVPKVFKRENTTYQIPGWLSSKLRHSPQLQLPPIKRVQKFRPQEVLKAEPDPETGILQVDDDQRYGPLLLESLLRGMGPAPGRAIGAATQHAHTHLGGQVLEGVHGVLFRRKFFDDEIFNFKGFSPHCQLHDDLWISAHLARKGILREVLISRFGTRALSFGFGHDALYMGGAGSDNYKNFFLCTASLLKAFPKLWVPKTRVALVFPHRRQTWTLRGMRSLAQVAQAAYVFGQVSGKIPSTSLRVPEGQRFNLGPWHQPVEIYLGSASTAAEDASSIIVLLTEVPGKGLQKIVSGLVNCIKEKPKSRNLLCEKDGGLAFWRHAAYPPDRIRGAIFLPKYSEDFHSHRVVEETQGERLDILEKHSQEDPTVRDWFQTSISMHRRVVAVFSRVLSPKEVRIFLHVPKTWRTYVAVKAPRRRHGCVPRVMAMRFRRRILCLAGDFFIHPLEKLLDLERWPKTLILLTGQQRPSLLRLLHAVDLWAGVVLANHAYAYGKQLARQDARHTGPIPDSFFGVLYRRSFLDVRFREDLKIPNCVNHLDLILAAHVALKSIPTEVLGSNKALHVKPGATECWAALVYRHPRLWGSVTATRSVLYVSLLNGTDPFLLDLTLRYAATQSNKPDEIVLLSSGQRLLEERHGPSVHLEEMGHVEVHLPDESWKRGEVKRRGEVLPIPLHHFLGSIRDKAGCVLYAKRRSVVLSVMSCAGVACGPRMLLGQAFERELEPDTALIFSSAERLVNERLVEENVLCLETCRPHCSQQTWCGQATTREDGALSDLTLRRSAGYLDHTTGG